VTIPLEDDDDTITVSVASRHGRTKLHTFIRLPDDIPRDGFSAGWGRATPRSHRQRIKFEQEHRQLNALAGHHPEHDWLTLAAADFRPTPRRTKQPDEVLGRQRVDLGEGVNPVGFTLAVVLDALHSDGRREVDLGDVKVVLSQLGSRITALDTLTDEQRQHAENALYSEIVRRCTKV